MDIYKYAEETGYEADYYDMHTGYIYGVAEYNRARRFGLPVMPIKVYDQNGNLIGTARRNPKE